MTNPDPKKPRPIAAAKVFSAVRVFPAGFPGQETQAAKGVAAAAGKTGTFKTQNRHYENPPYN
jgi:hypothetical protein